VSRGFSARAGDATPGGRRRNGEHGDRRRVSRPHPVNTGDGGLNTSGTTGSTRDFTAHELAWTNDT
jgi:hypothetical protein